MAREYTTEEVRKMFLDHVRDMVDYWDRKVSDKSQKERLNGLAFSILVLLDGGTNLPGFSVCPSPHKDDKAYHEERDENWFPECEEFKSDIGGALHEHFYK